MRRRQVFSWLSCVLAVSGLSAQQGTDPAVSEALLAKYKPTRAEFQFGLIGDQQYNAQQEAQFPAVIRAMDREPLAFVAHDGDIKGGQRCTDELFRDRLRLFQSRSSTHRGTTIGQIATKQGWAVMTLLNASRDCGNCSTPMPGSLWAGESYH
jgi:hypothetical protein